MLEAEWAFSGFESGPSSSLTSDAEEVCQVVEAMLRSVVSGVVGHERSEDVSVLWKQNNLLHLRKL